jgi:CcmD family protein
MAFLVAAFTVIWIVTFVFILSMAARQRRLAEEIENLREQLDWDRE